MVVKLIRRIWRGSKGPFSPHIRTWLAVAFLTNVFLLENLTKAARPLSVLVIPNQGGFTLDTKPFGKDSHTYKRLRFDNSAKDWQELEIGHQKWLCGELQDFAEKYATLVKSCQKKDAFLRALRI